jgi:hypothetical protein
MSECRQQTHKFFKMAVDAIEIVENLGLSVMPMPASR